MDSSGRYDPRILAHPEYARAYEHYLRVGSDSNAAAQLAYEYAEKSLRLPSSSPPTPIGISANAVAIAAGAIGICVLVVCGGGIILARSGDGQRVNRADPPRNARPHVIPRTPESPTPTPAQPTVKETLPTEPTATPGETAQERLDRERRELDEREQQLDDEERFAEQSRCLDAREKNQQVAMPNLVGLKLNIAYDVTHNACLPHVTVCRSPDGDVPLWPSNWRVIGQSVPAGKKVSLNAEVCLDVIKQADL